MSAPTSGQVEPPHAEGTLGERPPDDGPSLADAPAAGRPAASGSESPGSASVGSGDGVGIVGIDGDELAGRGADGDTAARLAQKRDGGP